MNLPTSPRTHAGISLVGAACLALALAPACVDDGSSGDNGGVPAGFETGWSVDLRVEAEEALATSWEVSDPIFGPIHTVAVEPPQGEPWLVVTESRAWRLRRYPITSTDPVTLGPPELVATATPDLEGTTWIPTAQATARFDQDWGAILTASPSGTVAFSGARGELFVVRPEMSRAALVGVGLGGLMPAPGVDLGAIDGGEVTGALLLRGAEGGEELLVSSEHQVLLADLDAYLAGRPAPLRHIAGSPVDGPLVDGGAARRAPTRFVRSADFAVDGAGNLFMVETGVPRVLMVSDFRSEDARVHHIAGGGFSVNLFVDDPRETSFEARPGKGLNVAAEGDARVLTFPVNGFVARLELTLAEDGSVSAVAPFEAVETSGALGGVMVAGGETLAVYQDSGVIVSTDRHEVPLAGRFPEVSEDDEGEVVTAPLPSTQVPIRPSMVMLHTQFNVDQDILVMDDHGAGHLFALSETETEQTPIPLPHPPNTTLSFPRVAMNLIPPPAGPAIPPTVTQTLNRANLRYVSLTDRRGQPRSLTSSIEPLMIQRPLGSTTPTGSLWLRSSSPDQLLLYDSDVGVIGDVSGVDRVTPSSVPSIFAGCDRICLLPANGEDGLTRLDLSGMVDVAMGRSPVVTFALRTGSMGSLVGISPLVPPGSQGVPLTIAGSVMSNQKTFAVAGGGALPLTEGLAAREVGFAGLTSAATLGDAVWFAADAPGGQRSTLFRVDAEGLLQQIDVDLGGRAPLAPGVRLRTPACTVEGSIVLLTPDATWLVNGLDQPIQSELAGAMAPYDAIRLTDGRPIEVTCDESGDLLIASETEDGATLLRGTGERLGPLPGQTTSMGVAGQSLVVSVDEAPALLEVERDASGAPTGGASALTGLGLSSIDGVVLLKAGIADDGILLGAPDNNLYGVLEGAIVRATSASSRATVEVVWVGDPLTSKPTAAAPWYGRERSTLLFAVEGRLYAWQTPEVPPGEADGSSLGRVTRVAGGGRDLPGLGGPATAAKMNRIHGIATDGAGTIYIRWDRYLGRIVDGRLTAIAGGGAGSPGAGAAPQELRLSPAGAFSSPLALTASGDVVLADPARGAVLRLSRSPSDRR